VNIKEYEPTLKEPLRQATNTLLLTEKQILLGLKKRGWGMGKLYGIGGKPNPGETIPNAAKREIIEEINVIAGELEQVAVINFFFPFVSEDKKWNQQVLIYLAKDWSGEPEETEEMKPQWNDLDQIPYSEMWADNEVWLPIVLAGKKLIASFMFDENEKIIDQIIEEVQDFGGNDQDKL
jgi:8-oxo-dGTP pyrophosphatase MutT (NUDIX family)